MVLRDDRDGPCARGRGLCIGRAWNKRTGCIRYDTERRGSPRGDPFKLLAARGAGPEIPPPAAMGCVTPCTLQVKRADKMTVTVTKPGFATESFSLVPAPSGAGVGTAVFGNVLAGGVVGVVVDSASGAMLDHCPNPVRLTLRPQRSTAARGRPAPATGGVTYDPIAACKAQTEAKYASNQPPGDNSAR